LVTCEVKTGRPYDNTKHVETDAVTTVANAWETLTFDFNNNARYTCFKPGN
jgi:hypothetical protein